MWNETVLLKSSLIEQPLPRVFKGIQPLDIIYWPSLLRASWSQALHPLVSPNLTIQNLSSLKWNSRPSTFLTSHHSPPKPTLSMAQIYLLLTHPLFFWVLYITQPLAHVTFSLKPVWTYSAPIDLMTQYSIPTSFSQRVAQDTTSDSEQNLSVDQETAFFKERLRWFQESTSYVYDSCSLPWLYISITWSILKNINVQPSSQSKKKITHFKASAFFKFPIWF